MSAFYLSLRQSRTHAAVLVSLALLASPLGSHATGVSGAARDSNTAAVRAELAAGADVNAPDNAGTSALLWAAYNASPELASVLLAAGADPNAANPFGVTPLLQATRNGDAATTRLLLDAGADVGRAVREGETPLMAAARTGNVDTVRMLLESGADVNAVEASQNQTALMWAVAEGHLPVVDVLLAAGADPNAHARVSDLKRRSMRADFATGGFTALMWAARNGNEAMVRRLIDGGADVQLVNGDGASAMMLAIVNDRFDMALTLLGLGADANDGSLYYAVVMRDAPTDWRARDGSRLRADHDNSVTALELVARLLEAGADPDKPFSGQMHSATMCCDGQGSGTPFFRAAVAADVELLKLMIAHDADLEWTLEPAEGAPPPPPWADTNGFTPLMAALNGGKGQLMDGGPGDIREGRVGVWREPGNREPADAVRVLLEAGANADYVNSKGDTALHIAAHDGKLGPIRELIAHGASVELRNKDGLTALQLVDKMQPRVLNAIAEMIGIFDDGATPAETAKFLREQIAARR